MQKYKRIKNQIISNELNNTPMKVLFIIQPKELTNKDMEHVEIDELIMKEPDELVAFKKKGLACKNPALNLWLKNVRRSKYS